MSTLTKSISYRHDNDCLMQGCPGHEMVVTYQSTSDYITVRDDDTDPSFGFDLNQLTAFIAGLKAMNRSEIEGVFERAEKQNE